MSASFPDDVVEAALPLMRRVSTAVWDAFCEALLSGQEPMRALPATLNPDIREGFGRLISMRGTWSLPSLGAAFRALRSADSMDDASETEIIWSGPANGVFPVRRTDQVLYDLIRSASRRILLVTFAAARVPLLMRELEAAVQRGVALIIVGESEEESEGQLTVDALKAFPPEVLHRATLSVWPVEKRPRNRANKPAKLHAKCAVIDDNAIISSANLTEDAFGRNMELGLVIRGGKHPDEIWQHFSALIQSGVLREK